MQNCLGELNLIYCLIYLDDIVVFSHTAEEHLHWLNIIFDHFREENLKLKPLKCNFFKEEITYLVHWVSKNGVWPSNMNLKAIIECVLPQTYTEVHAFLSLVGHYRRFIKAFAHIMQPRIECLAGEGASRKSEWVSLSEDALKVFEALNQAYMTTSVLALADYTNPVLVGDWCVQEWIRGSAVTEAGRQMISPCCLQQQALHTPWRIITRQSLSSWSWSGQLQNMSRSTCPINLSW